MSVLQYLMEITNKTVNISIIAHWPSLVTKLCKTTCTMIPAKADFFLRVQEHKMNHINTKLPLLKFYLGVKKQLSTSQLHIGAIHDIYEINK